MFKTSVLSSIFVVLAAPTLSYSQAVVTESRVIAVTVSDSRPAGVDDDMPGRPTLSSPAARAVHIDYESACDGRMHRVQVDMRGSIDGGARCGAFPG
ncbi:hypothetical protein [Paraburkholderia terricola]|uniref:UrcA family protein n=1 Tax=Paraburkholderia terricola TaxID=169427 RepID=A0ABU1LUF1_9BURK|nr:hypothetical protein [Paraburkholderia terricola]MDR6410141.1 hypothetical protein [Paraburkholderia terricola]MDR6481301.1 hypothetical protein [Paraburkholderia terricola]